MRLKRFKKGGDKVFLTYLIKQLSDKKKKKYCDYVVVNEKKFKYFKKNLLDILNKYE